MDRYEYNLEILKFIIDNNLCKNPEACDKLSICVEAFTNQRFGQIVCNYICDDYRSGKPSDFTEEFLNLIFPGNPDPFFEESKETYKRLISKK